MKPVPLIVDLDGTLIRTDMLLESLVAVVIRRPTKLGSLMLSLIRGRAQFKKDAGLHYVFNSRTLPFRQEVLGLIHERSAIGDEIVLATAATEGIAKQIADHLGVFSQVISSSDNVNLSGGTKASLLIERYGIGGFDYVGNSVKDEQVWNASRKKYLAGNSPRARRVFNRFPDGTKLVERGEMKSAAKWLRAMRVHQWVKNLLLFAPAIAAHEVLSPAIVWDLTVAFVSISIMASAVYLINDIVDIEADRVHPTKKFRPIPSGDVSIGAAASVAIILCVGSFSVSLALPVEFSFSLVLYFALTTLYTFWLKRVLLVDVLTLALLYTIRVVAGGLAVGISVSAWLLAFSFFLFLSLSFLKRASELALIQKPEVLLLNRRAYEIRDLPIVNSLGIGSGLVSTLVLALYLDSETVTLLYAAPQFLWLSVPLLTFWISWVWLKSGRGEVDHDPILFALKDRVSVVSGVLFLFIFIISQIDFSSGL